MNHTKRVAASIGRNAAMNIRRRKCRLIFKQFQDRFAAGVSKSFQLTPPGMPPFYNEHYWTGPLVSREAAKEYTLSFRFRSVGARRKQLIFYPTILPAANSSHKAETLQARLRIPLAVFRKACTSHELTLLAPHEPIGSDETTFRTRITNVDMEKASILGDVCSRILDKKND